MILEWYFRGSTLLKKETCNDANDDDANDNDDDDAVGWYNRKENTLTQLIELTFVSAMGPPGGGRTRITQR